MSCFQPKHGWKRSYRNKNGKFPIIFNPTNPAEYQPGSRMEIPCGKCIGCRADRAHEWAIRIYQEASLYDRNCFITLTYDDEHLPADGKISKKTLQDFWKRLRHQGKIRYFACGEYGEKTRRPHYHAIIFGQDFLTPETYKINDTLYSTPVLTETWGLGAVIVAEFNMSTACYVAGYVQKKSHDIDTFNLMSTRPGIGSVWLQKYVDDVSRLGSVVIEGKEQPVPRRYFLWALDEFEHIKQQKQQRAKDKQNKLYNSFGVSKGELENDREKLAKSVYMKQKLNHQTTKEKI